MSDSPDYSVADDLAVALTLAAEADLIAMDRYRAQDLGIQTKADKSIVTDADTRVERMIRAHLAEARPHDAVLGEEFGSEGSSNRQWIVDPIDGTSNFARGVPIWGALIALLVDDVPVVGVVSAPALERRWWGAAGLGAWVQHHGGEAQRIRVSRIDRLTDATLSYNNLQTWDQYGHLDTLVDLSRRVGRTRAFGDLWSYMLLAEGSIDIAGEFDVKPWDIAALVPIVTEAGGRVTTISGSPALDELNVVATNGLLHDEVLGAFAG
ncbi:histidinol phosphatase [Protaetiibacter sp. SSC-01]|uniref:inositol monophosphatase family protein n=1 Tax=Protaetiibacter sp. SSC-01 TaxID=2759943 RepID=UPI001656E6DA|nr:inositol monophosphatase family protein [Protaetiibacter sp. SSC-01]QNO38459.1 histidinol phosphatase [Protaetiibacter sp. SSC-01]